MSDTNDNLQPLCFVLMPFGKERAIAGPRDEAGV